jgi:nucleotide-binding universal stress UspA family protein
LDREAAEIKDFVPRLERVLIAVDRSQDGKLASMLAGLFVGTRQTVATVLDLDPPDRTLALEAARSADKTVQTFFEMASAQAQDERNAAAASTMPTVLTKEIPVGETAEAVLNEAQKGYDMLFLGVEHALKSTADQPGTLHRSLERIIRDFDGATAIVVAKGLQLVELPIRSVNILVPTSGTDYSRRAAELAMTIAKACQGRITALHVSPPPNETALSHRPHELLRTGHALLRDIRALGERAGVHVTPVLKFRRAREAAILHQIKQGKHNLVVFGVKARPAEGVFFGHAMAVMLERTPCSLILVHS